jgi:hypothetical protein
MAALSIIFYGCEGILNVSFKPRKRNMNEQAELEQLKEQEDVKAALKQATGIKEEAPRPRFESHSNKH